MSPLGNIIKKELQELLTISAILPIIIIAILFGSIGSSMEGIQEEFGEPPVLGYINEDGGNLSFVATSYLEKSSEVVFNSTNITDKQKGLELIKQKDGVALIIIKQGFSSEILNDTQGKIEIYWIMKGAGILDSISSEIV